jgi:thioredoxin reductase
MLLYRNKPLAVIGGGDSAAEEATCKCIRYCASVLLSREIELFPKI